MLWSTAACGGTHHWVYNNGAQTMHKQPENSDMVVEADSEIELAQSTQIVTRAAGPPVEKASRNPWRRRQRWQATGSGNRVGKQSGAQHPNEDSCTVMSPQKLQAALQQEKRWPNVYPMCNFRDVSGWDFKWSQHLYVKIIIERREQMMHSLVQMKVTTNQTNLNHHKFSRGGLPLPLEVTRSCV